MKKFFLLAALFIGSNFQVFSQSLSQKKDSLKIDSLKKLLPSLKGTNRVDCMVLLCEYYVDASPVTRIKANDSIYYYGNMILSESKILAYKKGIAMGLLASKPDSLKEKNTKEAIRIGEEIGNDEVLAWGYTVLTQVMQYNSSKAVDWQIKAIDHFHKAGNLVKEATMCNWLSQDYQAIGDNEKAFDYEKRSRDILKTIPSSEFASAYSEALLWSYWTMSMLYSSAGDYEGALNYMRLTNQVDKADDPSTIWGGFTMDIAGIYTQLGKYDSALIYWNRARNEPSWDYTGWKPGKTLAYNGLANIYIAIKQYDKAIEILTNNNIYFDSLIKYYTRNYQHAGYYGRMAASLSLAQVYDSLKNYETALQLAKDGFNIARQENRRPEMMQGYQLLSSVYHHLGKDDNAYEFLLKYHTIKDSVESKQFLLRIYNSKKEAEDAKKESRIGLLDRDNKIKQQQLKQESTFRNFAIAAFVALLFAGLYVFRNINLKRKNEKLQQEQKEQEWKLKELETENKHVELQKQSAELEMQALRAQMNPHFIFNSLSSINHFILKNESKTASNYLTRFSRLMRMVLMNSQRPLISLEDELQMLSLYLEMERLRFKNSFDYGITFLNAIDSDNIFIPPLLLQPFCENAIWHGLMHKEGQGRLDIGLSMQDNILNCTITDNGVGREKAEEMKSKTAEKEKSLGLKITTERLALLNREKGLYTFYEIEDLKDENGNAAGTKATLKISFKESVEEGV